MNPRSVWLGALVVVAAVAVVEESRIASLREQIAGLQARAAAPERPRHEPSRAATEEGRDPASATKRERDGDTGDGGPKVVRSAAESLRKITENPAARSLMNQAHKAMAAVYYADLIKKFDLTQSESEHFIALLAAGMAAQQEFGAKLLTAQDDATREDYLQQLKRKSEEQDRAIRDFLNDDDDFLSYKDYVARLPERQQLDGIRTAMKDAADPLTPEQETRLVDAMHNARTKTMPEQLWGQGQGQASYLAPGAEDRFEQAWTAMQQSLRREVGDLLDPRQSEAFFRHQEMLKEMQLGSIRMARKLFEEGNPNAKPPPVTGP